ncbi:hypothetical protein ACFQV2_01755 [Actinokineospora soli]|uniref:Tetratricopeptide repeat-containing protein n=1 Tax=Actinokineospora soli TaxID=1048753 RepID=A0ABW2TGK0_9PSEU
MAGQAGRGAAQPAGRGAGRRRPRRGGVGVRDRGAVDLVLGGQRQPPRSRPDRRRTGRAAQRRPRVDHRRPARQRRVRRVRRPPRRHLPARPARRPGVVRRDGRAPRHGDARTPAGRRHRRHRPRPAQARPRRRADRPLVPRRGLLGRAYVSDNSGTASEDVAAEALAGFRALGDRWGQALANMHLAEHHSLRGDHPAAIAAHTDAVRLIRELGADDELCGALARLGVTRARADDLDGAERDLTDALHLAEERGGRELAALALFWLAMVARRRGDLDRAARLLADGEAALSAVTRPSPQWTAIHLCTAADLARATGDPDTALAHLRDALTAMAATPDMPVTATIADAAALVLADTDPARAARLVGIGVALRGRPDLGNPELATLHTHAGAALDQATALAELADALQPIRRR